MRDVVDAIADAIRRTNGARLLDYSVRRLAQPIRVHDRRSRDRCRAGSDGDLRSWRSRRSTSGRSAAYTPESAPWTSSRLCRSTAARWRNAPRSHGERALPLPNAFRYPCISTKRRPRTRRARTWRTSDAASSRGWRGRWHRKAGRPTSGRASPHPTAGASVVGARMPLIAYNINLATDRLDVAKKIAAAIRHSSGGYQYVKAMGVPLESRGIVQVSMNLTNYAKTPMALVFEAVKREAARYGVTYSRERNRGAGSGCRPGARRMRPTCRSRTSAPARSSRTG